ncbi:MAG: DUF5686 and carboxypeptidase-like regulatory domain-containing protein [Candidatus Latescibacterota bacterium]
MRMALLPFLGLLLLLNSNIVFAQKTIRGRVTDSRSGKGLPSAHVAIVGQRAGTVTNDEGFFHLGLSVLPVKIRFSSIGYYSKEIEITADSPEEQNIALSPNPVMLDEIVVTDEDPAIHIMREVIRRKQIWRAGLEKYTATGYARVTLGNGKRNVMKVESVLDVAWDKNRGFTTRRKAKRQNGKQPPSSDVSLSNMNLYDDEIKVFDQRIFGITHPSALDVYSFRLIGRRKIDDKTVYDILVAPKQRYEKLLTGEISVLDEEFGMIEAKLRPSSIIKIPLDRKSIAVLRKGFLPPPKIDMEVALEQQFDNFGGGCWLPIGEKFTGKLDLGWQKLLALPSIRWEETVRFTDFTVSALKEKEVPAERGREKKQTAKVKVEAKRGEVSIGLSVSPSGETPETHIAEADSSDTAATADGDSTQIRDSDFIPPAVMFYTGSDSTASMSEKELEYEIFQAFRPTGVVGGLISRKAEKEIKKELQKEKEKEKQKNQAKQSNSSKDPKPKGQPNKLEKRASRGIFDFSMLPSWSYNRADGHNPGLKLRTTVKKKYAAEALGLYQTGQERFTYDSRFLYPFGKQSPGEFEIRAADGTTVFCDSPVYSRFVNSFLTLLGSDDYFDYYRSINQSVRVKYSLPKHRIDISGAINREKHLSLDKTTDFNLFRRDVTQRENPPVEKGRLGSVSLSLGWGDEAFQYLLGNQRRVDLFFEYADPGIFSGDFAFLKFQVSADWRFKTFFREGLDPNTLDVRFVGMASDGDLPVQRFGRIESRLTPLTPYGTFRSLRSPLAGEHLCALFWEHNFKTVPFEIMRLKFLARRGTEIILHGASGRTWISKEHLSRLPGTPDYPDRFHHELGLSLNNIYAGLRADVTKDLGCDTVTWGIGYKRPF